MTNICVVEGRLLYEPKLSETLSTKKPVCTFKIVCPVRGPKGPKEWITCEIWDQAAVNFCKYMHKGDRLTVTGYLHSKRYEDPLNRAKDIYDTVVSVTSISFGENRKELNENDEGENEE